MHKTGLQGSSEGTLSGVCGRSLTLASMCFLCISCTAGITTHRLDLDSPFRRNSEEGLQRVKKPGYEYSKEQTIATWKNLTGTRIKPQILKGEEALFFFYCKIDFQSF